MNGTFLLLPVLFPIIVGIVSYFFPFSPVNLKRRHLFFGIVIGLNTLLTWTAIFLCDGDAVTFLRFSDTLSLMFHLDQAGRIFAGLSSALWPVTMVYAYDYMSHYKEDVRHLNAFWSFFTAAFGVTLGIAFAGNLLTMYVFYEFLTLTTLPLVMFVMGKRSIKAGQKYLLYSMSGAALGFIGLVFLIGQNAQTFVYGGHLAGYTGSVTLALAVFTLSFLGFGVKAALWPFHDWLPSAAIAPTPVTALLHAVAVVKAGAFACIRLTYYAFGTEFLRGTWAQTAVMALAAVTIVYGSAMALKQQHFKRRLAYSTISNLSYILFAAALMTPEGLLAAWVHLVTHSVIKLMCFFAAGSVLHYAEREFLDELEGLGRKMPVTFACFTVGACALTGIPPFNGFVSKWYIALAAVRQGGTMALIGFGAVLLSALLTTMYMFQTVISAWFPRRGFALPEDARESSPLMWVPMVLMALLCLVMGLVPGGFIDFLGKAVTLG